jgi:hypothetical protein
MWDVPSKVPGRCINFQSLMLFPLEFLGSVYGCQNSKQMDSSDDIRLLKHHILNLSSRL